MCSSDLASMPAIAIAGMLAWLVFNTAGVVARRSATWRRLILVANAVASLLGLVLTLLLALMIYEATSAANLVALILLWIVAGGLALLGIAAFLGAWVSHPENRDGDGV